MRMRSCIASRRQTVPPDMPLQSFTYIYAAEPLNFDLFYAHAQLLRISAPNRPTRHVIAEFHVYIYAAKPLMDVVERGSQDLGKVFDIMV